MRKGVCFLVLILLIGFGLQAQTFDEWFEQKKTQIRYLKQQVAALGAYILVAEKGYEIAKEGTQAISSIKQGDFDMHAQHFSSLTNINQAIGGSGRVQDILQLQAGILLVADQTKQHSGTIPGQTGLVAAFFAGLLRECSDDLDWLGKLTTDGGVQMTDEERMTAIDAVYRRMQQRYEYAIMAKNDVL